MLNIESQAKALRMSWINRISKSTGWGDKAQTYFDEIGGLYFILRCFYDIQYLPKMPKFYIDILSMPKKVFQKIFSDSKSKCILWNNSLIRIGNKTIFLKDWYEKGVVYIHDLLNDASANFK